MTRVAPDISGLGLPGRSPRVSVFARTDATSKAGSADCCAKQTEAPAIAKPATTRYTTCRITTYCASPDRLSSPNGNPLINLRYCAIRYKRPIMQDKSSENALTRRSIANRKTEFRAPTYTCCPSSDYSPSPASHAARPRVLPFPDLSAGSPGPDHRRWNDGRRPHALRRLPLHA